LLTKANSFKKSSSSNFNFSSSSNDFFFAYAGKVCFKVLYI